MEDMDGQKTYISKNRDKIKENKFTEKGIHFLFGESEYTQKRQMKVEKVLKEDIWNERCN